MTESMTVSTAKTKKRNLTIRFCVAAIMVTSLLVFGITAASYLQMRSAVLQANLDSMVKNLDKRLPVNLQLTGNKKEDENLSVQWAAVKSMQGTLAVTFLSLDKSVLWRSGTQSNDQSQFSLSDEENAAFDRLLNGNKRSVIVDPHSPNLSSLGAFFGNENMPIPGLVKFTNSSQQPIGVLHVLRNYDYALDGAKRSTKVIFWYILGGHLLLFFALFYNFQLGLETIENQEKTLNQQISRLSNLLSINKSMQKSMKTASSRAVEMNEQFLRRVGSDLHDGPAQSLGYAIMRLNRLAADEQVKKLSHEFHVVLEALDNSIEEIRGISSGLVLPELEQMTLQEALNRVVRRHSKNSNSEVSEYYTDLPDDLPLPIKITAYRFVQEGLNNAHRHGQAEKCRISGHVRNGILHLSLKDNGMGFRKSQLSTDGGHLGLMGLKDRIESLGGKFSINSELGVGTAIKVSIAITDDAAAIELGQAWHDNRDFSAT